MPTRVRTLRARAGAAILAVGGVALSCFPLPLAGQEASVRVEENFRAEPNGTVIGRLYEGTRVVLGEEVGGWTQATVEGFVWLPSLQLRGFGAFDLAVSEAGGENLRDEPAGRVGARLAEGTLLEEVGRTPGWVRVRRTGWVWAPSLDREVAGAAAARDAPAPPPSGAAAPPVTVGGGGDGWFRSGAQAVAILTSLDGDTLARIQPGSEVRVLAREGNWARVQLEGWVWVPSFQTDSAQAPADLPVLGEVQVRDLSEEFERLRGRVVELDLQFISLERAEQVRTDFYEGEPFLLTRSVDQDRAFVYVAVPPELLQSLGVLTPLERIRVLGRVRSGAAAFTGSPILDLIELQRIR